MNLRPVEMRDKRTLICIKCRQRSHEIFADLDGEAYVDFYCQKCAQEVQS